MDIMSSEKYFKLPFPKLELELKSCTSGNQRNGCQFDLPSFHILHSGSLLDHPQPSFNIKCLPEDLQDCSRFTLNEFARLETQHLESKPDAASAANQMERRLFVKSSNIAGLGLFSSNTIRKDEFIIEYTGEICSRNEAYVRQLKNEYHDSHNYLMTTTTTCKNKIIDATETGNCSRYINHSCDPNCQFEDVSMGAKTRVIVRSLRAIAPDEELTCSYDWTGTKELQICNCGSTNCCGLINPPLPQSNVRRGPGRPPKNRGRGRPSKTGLTIRGAEQPSKSNSGRGRGRPPKASLDIRGPENPPKSNSGRGRGRPAKSNHLYVY